MSNKRCCEWCDSTNDVTAVSGLRTSMDPRLPPALHTEYLCHDCRDIAIVLHLHILSRHLQGKNTLTRKLLGIKVLQTPSFDEDEIEELTAKNQLTPIINRNGYYLDRHSGITWVEIDGKAFLWGTKDDFLFKLSIVDGPQTTEKQYNLLRGLQLSGLLKKSDRLYKLLVKEQYTRELREAYRSHQLFFVFYDARQVHGLHKKSRLQH